MLQKLILSVCALTIVLNASMASPSEIEQKFSKSASNFAAKLYQNSIQGKTGNVIISPVSVQTAVTLAMFGAAGETKQEMLKGLEYQGFTDQIIADNYQRFGESVAKTNGLKIANKIYVMKGYSVKPTFQQVATKSFNSEAEDVNFAQSKDSAGKINTWVENQTNNKIKNLISPDSLDADTRMVLVNAIYFKGFWTYQFDPKATFKAPFFLNDNDKVDVDFMKIKKHFKYGRFDDLDATALELPYKDSDITMLIILPNKRTGLAELESKLDTIDFNELTTKMYSEEVNVELPKFKIEFDIELTEPLKKMGMEKMFSDAAQFDELLTSTEPLKVSQVVHKAFIEVNEEGAEAAAATAIMVTSYSLVIGKKINFKCDRPFLFALMKSNESLFMGRIQKF
ncbi:hypothetical protein PVAND_002454 [Polypedilum vanderplanki]|uniref:Serpin domain-containing protein n=1 Tax=Polypedilum vanderplanki TaxID=319348 RepID=A0A9J6BRI4_POLVA|nr:hypothetical protein PVAND_002454 [Polypedilum vanderplanki]